MRTPRTLSTVPLARALSKLGVLSRAQAAEAIRAGRVRVNGRPVLDPALRVVPERARIEVDGLPQHRAAWRTLLFHKPRGVVTTSRDPEGRTTVFDVLGADGRGLIAVGRLDMATSGLLLLTSDTRLANWITDPLNGVARTYAVTVRGRIDQAVAALLSGGVCSGRDRLRADSVRVRKSTTRESHLVVVLREGRNREVRRLFEVVGHDVTRLKRVGLGELTLGELPPGGWRELSRAEVRAAFPGLPPGFEAAQGRRSAP